LLRTGVALATTLFPLPLLAQADAPAAPAADPAPAAEAAPAPAPVMAAAPLPPPPVVQAATPAPEPTVTTAAPTPEPPKTVDVNVWGRIGNNVTKTKGVDADTLVDAEVDLLLNGEIHPNVGWTADFVATYGPGNSGSSSTASILDLIGKFKITDELNVWFGRMLVPSDRSNFSGPWFMSAWNYPGLFRPGAAPVGPRQGAFGRNDGATVWGQFGGGIVKYYLGAFDLTQQNSSPLFTSRLNIALINPEPGFYHSSTYYGGKDIFAIGLSGQYKKDGSVKAGVPATATTAAIPGASADYTGYSADVLFEKNTGAGTLNLEGAYYGFSGDYEAVKNSFYGLASYLIPGEIGIGRLQPLVRYQQATPKADGAKAWKIVDAQIGYAIKEYAARLALGYTRTDLGDDKPTNAFVLGIQLQK
jgi:hypothetical protein